MKSLFKSELPKVIIIIQARMGSKRSPGKVLLKLSNKSVLETLINQVNMTPFVHEIYVATTVNKEDDKISALCNNLKINCFRGEVDNVLSRFISIANSSKAEIIIRLTADNPLVNSEVIKKVFSDFWIRYPFIDYVSNTGHSGYPYGLFVEIFKTDALKKLLKLNCFKDREHVTVPFRKSKHFKSYLSKSDLNYPNISLTVDTLEDYERVKSFYTKLLKINKKVSLKNICNI